MKTLTVISTILFCTLTHTISLSLEHNSKGYKEISASRYWNYLLKGNFKEKTQDEIFIYGVLTIGSESQVKVKKTNLDNRKVKKRAYIHFLENYIVSQSMLEENVAVDDMTIATKLTGLNFETRLEWVRWITKNKSRLELSEDGSMLVVKRCKKTEGLNKVIAKVGAMKVTYDEIDDDGCDEYSQNREITTLNKMIKDEVIEKEIDAMGYNPTETEIEYKSREIMKGYYEKVGEDEADREKMFERSRRISLTTLNALIIWQEDKQKGDEFARKELYPFFDSDIYWEQIKKYSDDEDTLTRLRQWEQFEDTPASEYINVYIMLGGDEFKQHTIEQIKLEKLKTLVVPKYLEMSDTDRENEFRAWLRKRMSEKTVIYDDDYKLALEID